MGNRIKQQSLLSNLLIDGAYILLSVLSFFGITLVPRPVNAIAVIVMYGMFLFLYRYVFKHDIGSGAQPLFVQSNIRLPAFLQTIINYFFAITFAFFPGYLLVICVAAATPNFSFDDWHPMIKLAMGIVFVAALIVNAILFGSNSGRSKKSEIKNIPEDKKAFFAVWVIPAASLLAGLSIGSLQDSWSSFSNDPGLILTLTLTTFVPFRYLVMRTGGISRLSLISFFTAVLFSIGTLLYQIASLQPL
ncbi:MAG: hypothetical protein JW904_01735 [Spirochaetales bacterium]|nr:hypothetical protein [Spirochaetales bacterium]